MAFQYTASGFLVPNQPYLSLYAWQLDSCTNCLASTIVPAVVFQPESLTWGDQIDFADYLNNGTVFSFPFGAFTTPGTYYSTSPYHPGTLTVSTPEPSTFLLLGCGLLLMMSVAFRRPLAILLPARG